MQKLGQSSTNGYLKYRLPYGTKRISLVDLIPFNVSDGWTRSKAAGLTGAVHLCEQALAPLALARTTCSPHIKPRFYSRGKINRTYSGLWSA